MDQEIKKSCWGITFWTVMAFIMVLGVAYLIKQDGSRHSASIATEINAN